jgi:hypothetical protein
MKTETLAAITKESIKNQPFPLHDLLVDSFYYPSSGFDGSPIRHWPLGVNSFVYVDMATDSNDLNRETSRKKAINGYKVIAERDLKMNELVPTGFVPKAPDSINKEDYLYAVKMSGANLTNTFATWFVLERDENLDDSHGPNRFSLLYLRAEGLATYQALYIANNVLPKIIANIRPGEGFGGNFNNFSEEFYEMLNAHAQGLPPYYMVWHNETIPLALHEPWLKAYKPMDNQTFTKDHEPEFVITLCEKLV